LGKFVLSDSNGSSDVDNDLTYPPVKSYEPISFPTPGKIGNDKPSDEENSDKFQGLTNGMKYHEKLVDESSRNILFIGQDRISGLYDTIGILSIDRKNKN